MTENDTTGQKKGFWATVRGWFRRKPRPATASPLPPVPSIDPNSAVFEYRAIDPITIPAEGGAYNFVIHPELAWSAKGMSHATLLSKITAYTGSSERTLRNKTWPVARSFPPHRPEEAEKALNEALKKPWCFDEQGQLVSCSAIVRVLADDKTVDVQRPAWEQLLAADASYRAETHRIELVRDLLQRWLDLIEHFGSAPRVIQAAQLTDKEISGVLRELAGMELAMGQDLVAVLDKVGAAHARVGLYEFAKSYDVAVRTYEKTAGLAPGKVSQQL